MTQHHPHTLPYPCPHTPLLQGYDIYRYASSIPGRDADPQPIIFAYISLNLQTLSQSGLIAPAPGTADAPNGAAAAAAAAAAPGAAAPAADGGSSGVVPGGQAAAAVAEMRQVVQQAMSDQQKIELKGRLKDIMSRLMHRDQSGAAMQELYVLRRCGWGGGRGRVRWLLGLAWRGELLSWAVLACLTRCVPPPMLCNPSCVPHVCVHPAHTAPLPLYASPTWATALHAYPHPATPPRMGKWRPTLLPCPFLSPPCREYPSFVERYIENTSDMFKNFIETGLAALEAQEAGRAGTASAAPAQHAQQQLHQQQQAAPATAGGAYQQQQAEPRRAPTVPPLELQRPPPSPLTAQDSARAHGGYGGYGHSGAPSPALPPPGAGPALSPLSSRSGGAGGNERLVNLRERLGQMRTSGDGSVSASSSSSMPVTSRSTSANVQQFNSSLEASLGRAGRAHEGGPQMGSWTLPACLPALGFLRPLWTAGSAAAPCQVPYALTCWLLSCAHGWTVQERLLPSEH